MVQSDFTLGKRDRATSERKRAFIIVVVIIVVVVVAHNICVFVIFILGNNAFAVLILGFLIVTYHLFIFVFLI